MPSGEQVLLALGLAALVAVAAVAVLVRRSARGLARIRRRGDASEVFARIARQVDDELGVALRQVEAVQAEQVAPGEIVTLLSETADSLSRHGDKVKTLALPAASESERQAFLVDLMHASSALESILDACLELEGSTRAERREHAPTAMKWGLLNLVGARQRLAERADQAGVGDALSLSGPSSPS